MYAKVQQLRKYNESGLTTHGGAAPLSGTHTHTYVLATDTRTHSSFLPPSPSHVHPSQHCSCCSADGEYLCPPHVVVGRHVCIAFAHAHATASRAQAISRFRVTSLVIKEKRCKSLGKSDVTVDVGYGITGFLYALPSSFLPRRDFSA